MHLEIITILFAAVADDCSPGKNRVEALTAVAGGRLQKVSANRIPPVF